MEIKDFLNLDVEEQEIMYNACLYEMYQEDAPLLPGFMVGLINFIENTIFTQKGTPKYSHYLVNEAVSAGLNKSLAIFAAEYLQTSFKLTQDWVQLFFDRYEGPQGKSVERKQAVPLEVTQQTLVYGMSQFGRWVRGLRTHAYAHNIPIGVDIPFKPLSIQLVDDKGEVGAFIFSGTYNLCECHTKFHIVPEKVIWASPSFDRASYFATQPNYSLS